LDRENNDLATLAKVGLFVVPSNDKKSPFMRAKLNIEKLGRNIFE